MSTEKTESISPEDYLSRVQAACITVLECEAKVKPLETKKSAAQKDHQKKVVERDEWLSALAAVREGEHDDELLLDELVIIEQKLLAAEKKADSAKSAWQSAKSKHENAQKVMNEIAMAAVDKQTRLNFEATSNESQETLKEKDPKANKKAAPGKKAEAKPRARKRISKKDEKKAEPTVHEFSDWRDIPVPQLKDKLGSMATNILKTLKTRGIRNMGQLDKLIETGFEGVEAFGVKKKQATTDAFNSMKEEHAKPPEEVSNEPAPENESGLKVHDPDEAEVAEETIKVVIKTVTPKLFTSGIKVGDEIEGTMDGPNFKGAVSTDAGTVDVVLQPADFSVVDPVVA